MLCKNCQEEIIRNCISSTGRSVSMLEFTCDCDVQCDVEGFSKKIINIFQPERLNPKGVNGYGMKAEIKEDGLCYFENGTIIDPSQPIDVCDSPNSENK